MALHNTAHGIQVTLTSQFALDDNLPSNISYNKRLVPVRNCRNIGKKDMLYNDSTPAIDVNPETYEVRVDGDIATVEPAKTVSLAVSYSMF